MAAILGYGENGDNDRKYTSEGPEDGESLGKVSIYFRGRSGKKSKIIAHCAC